MTTELSREYNIGTEAPTGTSHRLFYWGFVQFFSSLEQAIAAEKTLSWYEQQDSRIVDNDGQTIAFFRGDE